MVVSTEPIMQNRLHHYRDSLVLAGCVLCIMAILFIGAYWFSHSEDYELRRQWLLLLVIIPGVVHAYINRRTLWPNIRKGLAIWAIAFSILGFPLVYYAMDGQTYERFIEVRVSQVSDEALFVLARRLDREPTDLIQDLRHAGIEVKNSRVTVRELAARYDMPLRDFIHSLAVILNEDKGSILPESQITQAD